MLPAFLISGLFGLVIVIGLALLLHLQLGLARIANFGVVGFFGLGMYVFGVLYVRVDWPFGDPWQFLVCAAAATIVSALAAMTLQFSSVLYGQLVLIAAFVIVLKWRGRRLAEAGKV